MEAPKRKISIKSQQTCSAVGVTEPPINQKLDLP